MKESYRETAEFFRRTDRMLRKCIEKKVRTMEEGVYRSQHRLLMILGKNPNCSQNELATVLEISPAAVAVSLRKLEKGGYITREMKEEDRRSNQVAITEKGSQLICKSIRLFDQVDRGMFDGFDDRELQQFYELLQKVHSNLDRMLSEEEQDAREKKEDGLQP